MFAQMLELVALSDLTSVLCARKFSFATQGGNTTKIRRETDMASTHEDTASEISEIIFNMHIFAIEVTQTAKIV